MDNSSSNNDPDNLSGQTSSSRNSGNFDPNLIQNVSGTSSQNSVNPDVKKVAEFQICQYFNQLTKGCGNAECLNTNCASSAFFQLGNVSNNELAVKALELFSERAKLCNVPGAKVARPSDQQHTVGTHPSSEVEDMDVCNDGDQTLESTPAKDSTKGKDQDVSPSASVEIKVSGGLTESLLESTIAECKANKDYARLRILLWGVFSNEAALKLSFLSSTSRSSQYKPKVKYKTKDGEISADSSSSSHDSNTTGAKSKISVSDCVVVSYKDDDWNTTMSDDTMTDISKEQIRAAQCDLDKDIDSLEEVSLQDVTASGSSQKTEDKDPKEHLENTNKSSDDDLQSYCESGATSNDGTNNTPYSKLDIGALRRAYTMLFECPESEFSGTLLNAIKQLLLDTLSIRLKACPELFINDPLNTNVFIILLENPSLTSTEYIENVLGDLSRVISLLGGSQQEIVVNHFIKHWSPSKLHTLLQSLHQLITIKLLITEFNRDFTINDEMNISSATQLMKLLYYTSIYGGKLDLPLLKDIPAEEPTRSSSPDLFLGTTKDIVGRPPPWDNLARALGVHPLDAREPLIPLDEFYDDFLSDQLEMDRDFAYYKSGKGEKFSFLSYPFILTPATKALGLYYDNRIRMYSERRLSIYQTVMDGTPANPYLKLRIRREHIINDALMGLELVAVDNPQDLKKQLVVEFEEEQGIDEGGISKEFFQLVIEQLFNPDYAMFCLNQETQTFWFNPTSFENGGQFSLVGIILGLAIYNNVILDLHFPPVLYKKLCGKPGSFHDLKYWNPTLHRSLEELLNYEGDDMEDVFLQTFRIGYQDVFGANLHHDLKFNGENILVGQHNKLEFVNMYADFLLNKMVEQQFAAFRKGFWMVTDDTPLQHLFTPQELELLVCGSQFYDFSELMNSTEYDAGYTQQSKVIEWLWELIDEMSVDEKKQLLQFTTGSARVPVGGLARLKLVIARHGPDTDRLPTAHTCFNVLLLPEYSTKEKLKDRLLKAIKYAEGFGLL